MGQDQPVRSTVLVDLARRSLVPGSDPRSPGRGRRRQLPADLVAAEWRLIAAPSAPPQGGALFLCLSRPPASPVKGCAASGRRSEEHTSELHSLLRTSYAVFCLK